MPQMWGISISHICHTFRNLYEIPVMEISPGFSICHILINLPHLGNLPHLLHQRRKYFPHLPHMWELSSGCLQGSLKEIAFSIYHIPIIWNIYYTFATSLRSELYFHHLLHMWEIFVANVGFFNLLHMWEVEINNICPIFSPFATSYFPHWVTFSCLPFCD